jgi:hypothetical protein
MSEKIWTVWFISLYKNKAEDWAKQTIKNAVLKALWKEELIFILALWETRHPENIQQIYEIITNKDWSEFKIATPGSESVQKIGAVDLLEILNQSTILSLDRQHKKQTLFSNNKQ